MSDLKEKYKELKKQLDTKNEELVKLYAQVRTCTAEVDELQQKVKDTSAALLEEVTK